MMWQVRAAIAAVLLLASFLGGWTVQGWRRDSLDAEAVEASQELRRMNSRGANTAAEGHEKDKEAIRTEFQTITETVEKIVEKVSYRNVCFDDDGMRAVAEAIGNRPAASKPSDAMPKPDAAK